MTIVSPSWTIRRGGGLFFYDVGISISVDPGKVDLVLLHHDGHFEGLAVDDMRRDIHFQGDGLIGRVDGSPSLLTVVTGTSSPFSVTAF